MARQYGVQKVRLHELLALLADLEPISYSDFVTEVLDRFGCSPRAAQDSLAVLRRAHYVEVGSRQAAAAASGRLIDTGRRYYRVSDRGHYVLNHPEGPTLLRIARKLFTTSPSANVRRFRQGLADRDGSPEEALFRFERDLLRDPRRVRTLEQALADCVDWSNPLSVKALVDTLAAVGMPVRVERASDAG